MIDTIAWASSRVARIAAVGALAALGGCGVVGSHDVPPSTSCADRSTLRNCYCLEDDGCTCKTSTCAPGACVSTAGGAFCAVSGDPWPGCDSKTPTQNLCDGAVLFQCTYGYRQAGTPCAGTCVFAGGTGICAMSADPWPGCDPASPSQQLCEGNTPFQCQFGYRTQPIGVGRGQAPCLNDQRCISDGTNADCVAASAVLSPSCPATGRNVSACLGTTQITCIDGYIVDNRRCASCSAEAGCAGGFEAACEVDAECAPGFTCHPVSTGSPTRTCEVACTGTDTGNAQCTSTLVDTSLPYGVIPSTCGPGGWCGT